MQRQTPVSEDHDLPTVHVRKKMDKNGGFFLPLTLQKIDLFQSSADQPQGWEGK